MHPHVILYHQINFSQHQWSSTSCKVPLRISTASNVLYSRYAEEICFYIFVTCLLRCTRRHTSQFRTFELPNTLCIFLVYQRHFSLLPLQIHDQAHLAQFLSQKVGYTNNLHFANRHLLNQRRVKCFYFCTSPSFFNFCKTTQDRHDSD